MKTFCSSVKQTDCLTSFREAVPNDGMKASVNIQHDITAGQVDALTKASMFVRELIGLI